MGFLKAFLESREGEVAAESSVSICPSLGLAERYWAPCSLDSPRLTGLEHPIWETRPSRNPYRGDAQRAPLPWVKQVNLYRRALGLGAV